MAKPKVSKVPLILKVSPKVKAQEIAQPKYRVKYMIDEAVREGSHKSQMFHPKSNDGISNGE